MLYKDFKNIILEEETPELDTDGNSIELEKEKPKKTVRQIKLERETADGVGNEAFDIANKTAEFLDKVLSQTYKIGDIKAEKSMVIISDGATVMNNNPEEFTNVVQQYITAAIGADGLDEFDIAGPFVAGKNVNIVFTSK